MTTQMQPNTHIGIQNTEIETTFNARNPQYVICRHVPPITVMCRPPASSLAFPQDTSRTQDTRLQDCRSSKPTIKPLHLPNITTLLQEWMRLAKDHIRSMLIWMRKRMNRRLVETFGRQWRHDVTRRCCFSFVTSESIGETHWRPFIFLCPWSNAAMICFPFLMSFSVQLPDRLAQGSTADALPWSNEAVEMTASITWLESHWSSSTGANWTSSHHPSPVSSDSSFWENECPVLVESSAAISPWLMTSRLFFPSWFAMPLFHLALGQIAYCKSPSVNHLPSIAFFQMNSGYITVSFPRHITVVL